MTDLPAKVERVVDDAELPRRLRRRVAETLDARAVDDADVAADIVQAVQNRYQDTRVDPLEPVGTVSAQSIGEPGTQMSIPYDERVIVRRDGKTDVTEIGSLVDGLVALRSSHKIGGHEVAPAPESMEVLSLRADERLEWKPLEEVSRHESPDEMLRIELESGRICRATKGHSFVTRRDNEVITVAGGELETGDWLPVVRSFDGDGIESIDLREYLDANDYWFTSALTDGGVVADLPGKADQIRNKRRAVEAGDIDAESVYPVQGNVGLPEKLPLDEMTGFFLGAFLSEGSVTDYFVSISNVDTAFQESIRSFAERFDLSVNEYDNHSGFAEGHDIRVNGKVVADFVRATCFEDGAKTVPGFAYGAPRSFVRGLLTGYFSGDGNVGSRSIRASSTSRRLIEGIALLLGRFDIYGRFDEQGSSTTLRIPAKYVPAFVDKIGVVGERTDRLEAIATEIDPDGPDSTDRIPNFGGALKAVAREADMAARQVNAAHNRQQIGRNRLSRIVSEAAEKIEATDDLEALRQAVESDVVWERIEEVETIEPDHEYVYDFSVAGLETFTTAQGVITHNTMNTFHYAGVAEIDVTQGLPRLIELVDARKEPDTPMMTVYLEGEHATDRSKAHEVVWNIEATRILSLGDISTNVAEMRVQITLNEETLAERMIDPDDVRERIESALGVEAAREGHVIEFGPERPSYRELLQLVEDLREIVFKGIEDVSRVVIRKEELDDGEEFVLYTEGSAFGDVLEIEGVDASRTTTNDIHEIRKNLGIEAAREAIINETMDTLEEQGLDDVNVRHLMLVSDIMTNTGEISSIGRHGISGSKESVLARAAFEVTVNHLLDAAVLGEVDELAGVTENVIVGKPIKLGTGDVNLRVGAADE